MDNRLNALNYSTQTTVARQILARWRLIVALPITVLAAFLIIMIAQQQWQKFQLRPLRNKCLSFSLPPTTVMYDDDPLRSKVLLASNKYISRSSPLGWNPAFALLPVREFDAYFGDSSRVQPVAFLHECISPAGHRRLVAVNFSRWASDPSNQIPFNEISFFANFDDEGDMKHNLALPSPRGLDMFRLPSETVTIYAGQVDASDSSHFTIDYLLNNRRETIDGWLNDNESVSLVPRCGDIVWRNGDGTWIPGNAKRPIWIRGLPVTSLGHANVPPSSRPMPTP